MQIRIIIKENKNRSLLNEMSLEQAKMSIDSEKTKKLVFANIQKYIASLPDSLKQTTAQKQFLDAKAEKITTSFRFVVLNLQSIPDTTENQRALAMVWTKNVLLSSFKDFRSFCVDHEETVLDLKYNIEKYFQMQRFIEPREKQDLNRVKNYEELQILVNDARLKYQEYQNKKAYVDAEKGTEKIYDDTYLQIFIAHNKGAACQLGKGTDWCTAAPGLDYFAQYYKPEDPLFIFVSDLGPKFQFHYGSKQFMDDKDLPVDKEMFANLHKKLLEIPGLKEKYPIITKV